MNIIHPEFDGGILWNDPDIGIDWPTIESFLSDKDRKHSIIKAI